MNRDIANASDNAENEDRGINFGQIFRILWRYRGLLTILPLLTACVGLAIIGFSAWKYPRPVVYYIALQNIENNQYPNGTRFSPQDLLSPAVVSVLRSRFNFDQSADLLNNIQVSYDNPVAEGVAQKYRLRLGARNLTVTDVDSINAAYQQELNATIRSGLRIDVFYGPLGVGRSTAIAIAKALPEIWKDVYSQQFRVYLNTSLADAAVTATKEPLTNAASILVADDRLNVMTAGLGIIGEDNRLASLATKGGATAEDVRQDIQRFRTVYFDPLLSKSLSSADLAGRAYLKSKELRIADLERQIEGFDLTLDRLRSYQATPTPVEAPPVAPQSSGIQIGDNAVGQIVELAERAAYANYIQNVLERRQAALQEISGIKREIDFRTASTDATENPQFLGEAAKELDGLTGNYLALLSSARNRLDSTLGQFYSETSSPSTPGSVFGLRSLAILIAFALVGWILAVTIALLASLRPKGEGAPA